MTFQNIDKKFEPRKSEVELKLTLLFPYTNSFDTLLKMTNVWSMKIILGATDSKNAKISMTLTQFKKLFKKEPKINEEIKIAGTEKFIKKAIVSNIFIAEKKK